MIPKFKFYDNCFKGIFRVVSMDWGQDGLLRDVYVADMEGDPIPVDTNEGHLMQSTGLFDKNGVEIFEGDVVKFNDTWDEYDYEGFVDGTSEGENFTEIIKTEDGFSFGITKIPESSVFYFLNEEHMKFSEIIKSADFGMVVVGNIFENPELMKEETA